jgi:hypothetical protein
MFSQVRSFAAVSFLLIALTLAGCRPSALDDPFTSALQQEQSTNPATRISGTYSCVRLQLDNGYTEGRGQLKGAGYFVAVQAKGDSVQFSLTGDGTAGTYKQLDLGTYAVEAKSTGGNAPTYFTIKKDILTDYNAVTVIDRTIGGTSGRQITYSFAITLYQFLPGTARFGQYTPVKASDIFTTTQRVIGIYTLERTITLNS